MTSILENELVRKYFGCNPELNYPHDCQALMALRVLTAMQEPIKKGERYLDVLRDLTIDERVAETDWGIGLHMGYLRLPSQFQPRRDAEFNPMLAEQMVGFKWCGYDEVDA